VVYFVFDWVDVTGILVVALIGAVGIGWLWLGGRE
jgi:hypothetical protein